MNYRVLITEAVNEKGLELLREQGYQLVMGTGPEEETLLRGVYLEKRKQSGIPDERFVHFDIPLTLEHETELIQDAGFVIEKVLDNPDGATLIAAGKKGQ